MDMQAIALFGEAEKGQFKTAYWCRDLPQLREYFGEPPPESRGLYYAVQALHHRYDLIFFRVKEEGFSYSDYLFGLQLLANQRAIKNIAAFFLPGVGDRFLLDKVAPLCEHYNSVMVTSEPDLYDYLTS